jgi:hypothetical protein
MIEFMYYLRAGHAGARSIHAKYNGKPKPFIEAVRIFLTHQKENLSAASDCIETKNETPIPSHEDTKTSNEEPNHPSLFPSDEESLDTSRNNTTDWLQVRSFGGENESNRPQNIDVKDDGDNELELGPRKKIIATWSLPLEYLKKRAIQKYQEENQISGSTSTPTTLSVRSAIQNLTIGLFRRGCPEYKETKIKIIVTCLLFQ